jgi:type I restriction enzyme S subunit
MNQTTEMPLSEAYWFQEGPGVRNWQFTTSGIKLLNVANITKLGELDLRRTDRYLGVEEVASKYSHFLIEAGDLVIASSGISFDSDGLLRTRGAFVRESQLPLCLNTSTIRFKPKKNVSNLLFLKFWLDSDEFRKQITRRVTGSAQQNFGPSHLESLQITLPQLPEQKRIAALLEKADRLRRTRRYARQLSDALLQSVFLEMFGASFQRDESKARFGDLVKITGGGTPSRDVAAYFTGTIPWLTSKDMRGDYIFDTQEHITENAVANSATHVVPAGSILVVVKSKVLMHRLPVAISVVPLCHGQDIKSIQCSNELLPEFARYLLRYYERHLLNLARGANTEGLTLPMLNELLVPDVSLPLQQKFADIVRRFERLRAQQREAERQAEHLFQTLLHRAFAPAP